MKEHFRSVRDYPQRQDACGVIMRLIDGLGYRFYWATEGLTDVDFAFTPGGGCMTIGELVGHIWGLANWVHMHAVGSGTPRPDNPQEQRDAVLEVLFAVRSHIESLDEAALFAIEVEGNPFWHVINGPLADALTHTGQIASLRRINGNPVPKHNVFLCHE